MNIMSGFRVQMYRVNGSIPGFERAALISLHDPERMAAGVIMRVVKAANGQGERVAAIRRSIAAGSYEVSTSAGG